MAAHRRPSFLKREKERKRLSRALDKREAKQARRRARIEAASPEDAAEAPVGGVENETEAETEVETETEAEEEETP